MKATTIVKPTMAIADSSKKADVLPKRSATNPANAVLKDAPMPVVLLGALGGLATSGILGMFVGATVLTLGYQIFMGWVSADPAADPGTGKPGAKAQ